MARRNVAIARVGNYSAPVDTEGLDPAMQETINPVAKPTGMNKVEKNYLAGAKNKSTAAEAIRRTRRANK